MSDDQGPPPGHHFLPASPGYSQESNFSQNDPRTPSYGPNPTTTFTPGPYRMLPGHLDALRHTSSHEMSPFEEERVMVSHGRMGYPESSQRTDIPSGQLSSSYSFAGEHFGDLQATSTHHADLDFEITPKISPGTHSLFQPPPGSYISPAAFMDASTLPQHDAPDLQLRPQLELRRDSDRPFYHNEMSIPGASGSQSRKRVPSEPDDFQIATHALFQMRLEGPGGGSYHLPSSGVESSSLVHPAAAAHIPSVSSIPMSNQGWPPEGGFNPDSANFPTGSQPMASASWRPRPGPAQPRPPKKRKVSKMHRCGICGKQFPRCVIIPGPRLTSLMRFSPSGLRTHMNTHTNFRRVSSSLSGFLHCQFDKLSAFPCLFPGCPRTFTVRSNATRHLRTHGTDASNQGSASTPSSYTVGFNTPTIAPSTLPSSDEVHNRPVKLRWTPNLTATNTDTPNMGSDDDDSDDDVHESEFGDVDSRSASSIPFRPAIPSLASDPHGLFEESNPYLNTSPYTHRHSQVR
jgi:hypothetical protein